MCQTFPIKKVDPFVLLAANIAKLLSSSIHRSGKLGSLCPLVRIYRAGPRSSSVICVRQTSLIFLLLFKLVEHRGKTFDHGEKKTRSFVR